MKSTTSRFRLVSYVFKCLEHMSISNTFMSTFLTLEITQEHVLLKKGQMV